MAQSYVRILFATLTLCVCSAPVQAIVSGKPVTIGEQQQKGLINVNSPIGKCSGVLISNDWAMTAGHCADKERLAPGNIQVLFLGNTIRADAVYLFGGFADEVGPDLALLHLSSPFSIAGASTGFRNQIWGGPPHGLFGKMVAVYGQGWEECPDAGNGSSGTYHAADFRVDSGDYSATKKPTGATDFVLSNEGPYFQISRTPGGPMLSEGDSGGPSFIFDQGKPILVGISSGALCTNNGAHLINPQSNSANLLSLSRVRLWLDDVFKSKWSSGTQSQPVYVYPNEVIGTRWALADVNAAGWAQAARAAAAMCFNRGFAGGHFDGHQGPLPPVPGNGFGLQCSGGDTLWLDVATRDMDLQWRFGGDINAVNWAQAGRTAERICANRGYVGGQFNGHQRDGRYGIFCYRGGAQWFDATDPEIAGTGWGFPTPRLDDNVWAQAARAATGFCRSKGFSGGFMNGHQVPGRYGVVCQR